MRLSRGTSSSVVNDHCALGAEIRRHPVRRSRDAVASHAVTGPGRSRNSPVCAAADGRACSGVRSNNRRNRAFSARNAANSASGEENRAVITVRRARGARRTSPCVHARAATARACSRTRSGHSPHADQPANPPRRCSPTASSRQCALRPVPTPLRLQQPAGLVVPGEQSGRDGPVTRNGPPVARARSAPDPPAEPPQRRATVRRFGHLSRHQESASPGRESQHAGADHLPAAARRAGRSCRRRRGSRPAHPDSPAAGAGAPTRPRRHRLDRDRLEGTRPAQPGNRSAGQDPAEPAVPRRHPPFLRPAGTTTTTGTAPARHQPGLRPEPEGSKPARPRRPTRSRPLRPPTPQQRSPGHPGASLRVRVS